MCIHIQWLMIIDYRDMHAYIMYGQTCMHTDRQTDMHAYILVHTYWYMHADRHTYNIIQYLPKLYPKISQVYIYIYISIYNMLWYSQHLPTLHPKTSTQPLGDTSCLSWSGGVWTSVQRAGSHFNGKRWDGSAHTAAQALGSLNQCGAQSNWYSAGWQALWAVWLSASSCVGGLDLLHLGFIDMWYTHERWEDKHASLHHCSFGVLNRI